MLLSVAAAAAQHHHQYSRHRVRRDATRQAQRCEMVLRAEAEVFERSSFGFERARFSVSRTYYDLDSSVVLVADVGQLERSDFSVTEY